MGDTHAGANVEHTGFRETATAPLRVVPTTGAVLVRCERCAELILPGEAVDEIAKESGTGVGAVFRFHQRRCARS